MKSLKKVVALTEEITELIRRTRVLDVGQYDSDELGLAMKTNQPQQVIQKLREVRAKRTFTPDEALTLSSGGSAELETRTKEITSIDQLIEEWKVVDEFVNALRPWLQQPANFQSA